MNLAHRILPDGLPVNHTRSDRSESCTIVKPDSRPEAVIDGMDAAEAARVMSRCMVFLAAQGKDPLAVIGNAALTRLMQSAMVTK